MLKNLVQLSSCMPTPTTSCLLIFWWSLATYVNDFPQPRDAATVPNAVPSSADNIRPSSATCHSHSQSINFNECLGAPLIYLMWRFRREVSCCDSYWLFYLSSAVTWLVEFGELVNILLVLCPDMTCGIWWIDGYSSCPLPWHDLWNVLLIEPSTWARKSSHPLWNLLNLLLETTTTLITIGISLGGMVQGLFF